MASITITRPVSIAGTSYAVGATVTPSLTVAGLLIGEGAAAWTASTTGVTPLPNTEGEAFLALVTGYTGGGATKLDGYTTAAIPISRTFAAIISGSKKVFQLVAKGSYAVDNETVIEPPDFDSTDNNRVLVQVI